ncbi:helix-turn-helix domain-containing protein [Macrococcus epidermidis]|uniref:helix-turn-helix domain-containing protein n=1 Tax=Staphylococcaceae TaxID=90964 RepID=UPI001EF366B0|nr:MULTISPECIES: helix-turn-helix domain-containing protein [Macrococcus]MCG7419648.1 helix-turn-helix domain-containing protein [Macrococcus epidermidis]
MFLTVKEVSKIIRCSEKHTYKLISENVIPHLRINNKILIDEKKLFAYLEKMEVK